MKKKIAILGSTGSIGKSLLDIINPKDFEIIFLVAQKNYKLLFKQAKKFNVKSLIITDYKSYIDAIKFNSNKKIKIYNNYSDIKNIVKNKLDYVMSSISGIDGLIPTYDIIKFTKKIAIANKEAIICAWPLIIKQLVKYKVEFVPVDSEHFSIWSEIKNVNKENIKKIYLTASGGPLLGFNRKSMNKIAISRILKHPTWKMGKKISVDSATMMNKCFEVMEAKNIFDIDYNKIDILIHPNSYVHAIIVYKNGISKLVIHETTMKIPIFNTIYSKNEIYRGKNILNLNKLNDLKLTNIMKYNYPITKCLKLLQNKHSLFETVLVSINDILVSKFLEKKINFDEISSTFMEIINRKEFEHYKKIRPKTILDIINLNFKIKSNLSKLLN